MPKSFDELTFADDWMFQKVLHNPEISSELVERLLHIRVDNLNDKSFKVIYNATAYEKAEDIKIREFLRYIHSGVNTPL